MTKTNYVSRLRDLYAIDHFAQIDGIERVVVLMRYGLGPFDPLVSGVGYYSLKKVAEATGLSLADVQDVESGTLDRIDRIYGTD